MESYTLIQSFHWLQQVHLESYTFIQSFHWLQQVYLELYTFIQSFHWLQQVHLESYTFTQSFQWLQQVHLVSYTFMQSCHWLQQVHLESYTPCGKGTSPDSLRTSKKPTNPETKPNQQTKKEAQGHYAMLHLPGHHRGQPPLSSFLVKPFSRQ